MKSKANCTFCGAGATYKDGRDADGPPYACGNHASRIADPRAIDPVDAIGAANIADAFATEFEDDDEA